MTAAMSDPRPIIITLQLDERSDAFFNAQRERYFPPAINFIPAHLTLFHNLPGPEFENVIRKTAKVAGTRPGFAMDVTELMKLGRGVAYKIASPELIELRAALAAEFDPWLIKQDRQKFRPHITVQNKVAPHEANALFDHLQSEFEPFKVQATGLQLWFYDGGPWSPAGAVAFG